MSGVTSPGWLSEEDTAYERRPQAAINDFDDRVYHPASAYGVESRPGATRGKGQGRVEHGVVCRNADRGLEKLYEVVRDVIFWEVRGRSGRRLAIRFEERLVCPWLTHSVQIAYEIKSVKGSFVTRKGRSMRAAYSIWSSTICGLYVLSGVLANDQETGFSTISDNPTCVMISQWKIEGARRKHKNRTTNPKS